MDTVPHYSVSGLVYHPHQPHPHPQPIPSDPAPPHPSFPQDMSWRPTHQSPSHSHSASVTHPQMQPIIAQPQDHVTDYVHPSAQQSFISRNAPAVYTNHPPSSSSVDPGPSSHSLPFQSPQIDSSIGPDRGIPRRRIRLPDRVQSHGELSEYAAISQSYGHPQNPSYLPQPHQGSRPQTPTQQPVYQLSDQPAQSSMSTPDPYGHRMESMSRVPEWRGFFPPAQSRSASGSTASASSNPRSASPALSVASALTSVSSSASAPNSMATTGFSASDAHLPAAGAGRKEPMRKKRLWNVDRYHICKYAENHPGVKQEDIAAQFGVERSTVSKILKQKARWLHVSPEEKVLVAKLRPSKFPSLERRLEEWVKLASKAGKTLTDSVLRQKAREFGDEMGYTADKFKASSGWLENFKHRHGIRRGVWHGNGTAEQKHRAYASDFLPPNAEPIIPPGAYTIHQPSPTPMEEPPHGDHDMGVESEEEDGGQDVLSMNAQVMHPSIALQQAWPQVGDQADTHGEPSTAAVSYYSPEQPPQLEYQHTESVAPIEQQLEPSELPAILPPPEPIAIPLNGDENSGEQVYVVPIMPEVVPELTVPTLAEAEHALDKVILYVEQNGNEAVLDDDDYKFLMSIKYKVFGKMAGRKYDLPYGGNRNRAES